MPLPEGQRAGPTFRTDAHTAAAAVSVYQYLGPVDAHPHLVDALPEVALRAALWREGGVGAVHDESGVAGGGLVGEGVGRILCAIDAWVHPPIGSSLAAAPALRHAARREQVAQAARPWMAGHADVLGRTALVHIGVPALPLVRYEICDSDAARAVSNYHKWRLALRSGSPETVLEQQ